MVWSSFLIPLNIPRTEILNHGLVGLLDWSLNWVFGSINCLKRLDCGLTISITDFLVIFSKGNLRYCGFQGVYIGLRYFNPDFSDNLIGD